MVMRLLFIAFLLSGLSFGQRSEINQLEIKLDDPDDFSFIIVGHIHGSSKNVAGFPASTFLGNIDQMNGWNASFMASLGDLFLAPSKEQKNYQQSFFSKINTPIFNAVGNHDIEDFNWTKNFGKSTYAWEINGHQFIVLDLERGNGSLENFQIKLLKSSISKLKDGKNLFVFGHRPIFTEGHPKLNDVFPDNTASGTNFREKALPLLKKIPKSSNAYWFGGSIGGMAPVSFFYHREKSNVHFIATAIRDLPRDGVLLCRIKNDKASFECKSFTGQKLKSLETYDLKYWKTHDNTKPFNWRLLPLYAYQMITGWHFWIGVLFTILSYFGFKFLGRIIKKWKAKRNG